MQMLAPTAVENTGVELDEVDARPATSGDTGPSLFWQQVARRGETVVLRHKHLGVWQEITWSAFGENVRACAYGLMALGMQAGDRITILSDDRPEWLYADLAVQSAAGLSVGIYPTSGASQASYIVANSESKILLVEDQEQFDKVASSRHELPELEWVIVMDPKGVHEDDPTVMTFDELLERGRELERVEPRRLDERLALVKPDDTAFIIYTSGTTGPPKGAMHSHRSVLDGAKPLLACLGVTDREESIIYLPLCHAGERFFSYTRMLLVGGIFSIVESPETLFADVQEVAPTIFIGVPRTWEKLKSKIQIGISEATWLKQRAYRWALTIGHMRVQATVDGRGLSLFERTQLGLAEWTVLRKLRERLGLHRARSAWTAAAPIAPEMLRYFMALGIPIREGLGQTETGMTAMNFDEIRLGTVGQLVDDVQVRISESGELLFKGPGVFKGYFNNPEATERAFDGEWFHTGDKGSIDEDGFVTLEGRVVDMFVTSVGRNIAPQNFENLLKASDYIMDAVLVGDRKPFLTTLIVLDEETVSHYAQQQNVPFSSFADLASRPEIQKLIGEAVANVNTKWSDREQILDFRILKWQLSDEEDELTPTMKVRRKFLCERYKELIEEMYAHVG